LGISFEITLQNDLGGHGVKVFLGASCVVAALSQLLVGLDRTQPLFGIVDRQAEAAAQVEHRGQADVTDPLAAADAASLLRFLQRREVITLVTAPGDGEVTVVSDETMGEKDPLLARLLAAATAGAPPAGPANKRKPIRIVLDPDDRPVAKGTLCAQEHGFNLHACTKVAANDKPGRVTLCRYILRPPLANDRLHILPDGVVRLDFKKPWSDDYASHCTSFSLVDAIRCSFCPDA